MWKHFSFVVSEGKIISMGLNRDGESSDTFPEHAKIHSEVDAFRKAKGILGDDFSIINIRMNKSGHMRMSKPCEACERFLRAMSCTSIIYSSNEGFQEFKV